MTGYFLGGDAMHLIVTEKNISAERIAKILAGREKVTSQVTAG